MSEHTDDDDVPSGQRSSRRKPKKRLLSSDSSSSNASTSPILMTKRKENRRIVPDDSDSDSSGSSIIIHSQKKKRVARISSDSDEDSDSSDSVIIRRVKRSANIIDSDNEDQGFRGSSSSQYETGCSDVEDGAAQTAAHSSKSVNNDTDSSDGESDKCPICLLPIRNQELGTPESCDHLFCVECILEWSKNMNTCPVDRQEYHLILVRKRIDGKIVRQIPVEKPAPQQEPQEDPTCCEICGSGDREDRLLLCDGCDLGFHLECLTPPLEEVPMGSWFCNECDPNEPVEMELDLMEIHLLLEDQQMSISPMNYRNRRESRPMRNSRRLIPRTIQSQRVINRILHNRTTREEPQELEEPTSSTQTNKPPKKRKKKSSRPTKRTKKYRVVYEIDDETGDVISKKKEIRGRRKRTARRRRRNQTTRPPKTVKKRLAQQLGICRVQQPTQNLPDVRVQSGNGGLSTQRHQAGIPTLHLFGQRDSLEYFSGSDGEDVGNSNYLVRRRHNNNDIAQFRRVARRKGMLLPTETTVSSTSDLLSDILDSQSKFYSKDTKFSVDNSGKFKMEVDLNNFNDLTRKTPYGGNRRGNQQSSYSNSSYQSGGSSSYYQYDNYGPSSTSENYMAQSGNANYDEDMPQDYTQSTLSSYDRDVDSDETRRNDEQGEESDIDIYSDIEDSVSTSKAEEEAPPPMRLPVEVPNVNSDIDNENNDSDNDMVIDTEKVEPPTQEEEETTAAVTSSEDMVPKCNSTETNATVLHSTSEIQSESIQTTFGKDKEEVDEDDDGSEDGCPNFSIYSSESINLAKNTDITLNPDESEVVSSTPLTSAEPVKPPEGAEYDPEDVYDPEAAYNSGKEPESELEDAYDPERVYDTPEDTYDLEKTFENAEDSLPDKDETITPDPVIVPPTEPKKTNVNALYSDSEDEEVVKINKSEFTVGDISTMTEDVSEEERSYTPCLDEKASNEKGKGPDGLDTEMISDDEKNDFDESHEHKTASEGDALEINAKESEIDLIRPEDYEEGEIVDKNKENQEKQDEPEKVAEIPETIEEPVVEKDNDKENEPKEKEKQPFKKLSKNNKERNYRDKDRSKSRDKKVTKGKEKESNKERRRDKRKEIERYDVRALIAEKPRRIKDKFGRDVRKSSSRSRSRSRSATPARRSSPKRRSNSRDGKRKKRSGSSRRRSLSSRSRRHRRSSSRRRRSSSPPKRKRKPSKDRMKKRKRDRSTSRTYTPVRKRRGGDWEDRYSRDRGFSVEARWTPSMSRTPELEPPRRASPSWTPPRTMESAAVDPRNLTVILQNDQSKKRKEKRRKGGKRREGDKRGKRRRKDRTPPPSKEVFASGDNILVSVSFNKENETRERDIFTKEKKKTDEREKRKRSMRRKKKNQELSGIKPVAIIDLDRSPFRELTPSPKDIIILSDEEIAEMNTMNDAQDLCDSSQQVASPENVQMYMTGPKTPPEPQVKFLLPSKQQPLRPLLSNPLHDPEDDLPDDNENEDGEIHNMADMHKGPNTPPEPPNSPPSSPDAYDPFEPTKSRSPSPDPAEVTVVEDIEQRSTISDHMVEKNAATAPSLTPPIADVQPADSQSSLQISRDSSKSPDQMGRAVATPITKSAVPPTPFVPGAAAVTSTPVSGNSGLPRINILSSTVLSNVSSSIPQRVVLPNVKLSPVKNVVKSTPIKPMMNKNTNAVTPIKSKSKNSQQNGNDTVEVISLDFDSPYSPGSSDYEDLFEPPPEVVTKKTLGKSSTNVAKDSSAVGGKPKNPFDALFGSPVKKMSAMDKFKSKKPRGTKIVGVKLDEDHLKILDELPNSAVEMQVKDKFLKKLNRQERVVEEVKLVLKPYYNKKKIDKEEYKDIMRRAVPKICHNKSGEINPTRIKNLVEAYVKKIRHAKPKVTSSSSYNPLKG